MKRLFYAACMLAAANGEAAFYTEQDCQQRIHAHLLIHDLATACQEAREAAGLYPHSALVRRAQIEAFAKAGEEAAMWNAWVSYSQDFPPTDEQTREIAECMAWGVINKAAGSSSPIIRTLALLAALFSQDAKGIGIIQHSMQDTNTFVRGAAVQLAANLRDAQIHDEVLRVLRNESNWKVHLEAIKSAGKMRLKEAQPDLVAMAADPKSSAEEVAIAVQSLVVILDDVSLEKLTPLVNSNRAGLRVLACELVAHRVEPEAIPLLVPLLHDTHPQVRAAAVYALGVLRAPEARQPAKGLLNDLDPSTAMMAAWVTLYHYPEEGQEAFRQLLNHPQVDIQRRAAGVLAATGKKGVPVMREQFYLHNDPYVKVNLAFGLIAQRVDVEAAANALQQAHATLPERWMWDEATPFRALMPSKVKHDELIPNYPEAVNQQVRLEVLNVLAILKHPKAQDEVKRFLQERSWGVTGLASALLLTEGDDAAVDIVTALLADPNKKVRMQAALILSLWGGGEEALSVLEGSYSTADREMKEKILESVGRVGNKQSIPFLIDKLQEPPQTLRIIAAAALLQTLYH